MKISVDKEFTTLELRDRVKEDLKEFKARYTDGDLLRAFIDATGKMTPTTPTFFPAKSRGSRAGRTSTMRPGSRLPL